MENKSIKNLDLFPMKEQIRQAIEIEVKYQYINILGRRTTFAKFIKNEIIAISKKDKDNPQWKVFIEAFDYYPQENLVARKRTIQRFVKYLKEDNCSPTQLQNKNIKTNITYLKGVGPKIGNLMNKLGIFTIENILHYFPKRHIDYSQRTHIKNLEENTNVTIIGTIKSTKSFTSKKGLGIVTVGVTDGTGRIDVNWFYGKSNKFILKKYQTQFNINSTIILSGKVKKNKMNNFVIDSPEYQILDSYNEEETSTNLNLARIVPVYALSESLNLKTLRKAIFNAIKEYKDLIEETIPEEIRKKRDLMDKKEAIQQIHFPSNLEKLEKARYSLVFEELFLIQLKLAISREIKKLKTPVITIEEREREGLIEQYKKSLPFALTNAQNKAVTDIISDMRKNEVMQRLLQGDVGSGKTVVAAIMLLAAVENNYQGAIMAPTEILAEQHYNNFVKWMTPLGLKIGLFLGKQTKKQREEEAINLRNGQTHIAVGTHALIQENVQFNNLGAVVIDEQHRFGVEQRNKLRNKGLYPQVLAMSATPIPRTLALTMCGDLDVSVIDEMPEGRKPIKTLLISASKKKSMYEFIKTEIKNGHQAYIVYPLIEESETISAKAATVEIEKIQKEIFPEYNIGLIHGKLKSVEKDIIMNDFKNGKYQILVSTTVIEVGIDVKNATTIVIENAERFGLSQLHQLRGRVGRSSLQSYCFLVSGSNSQETKNRLNIMTETNNGFIIAEKDLALRGPGEFLGTRQSGLPELAIADLVRDAHILEEARIDAFEYVKEIVATNKLEEISNKFDKISS